MRTAIASVLSSSTSRIEAARTAAAGSAVTLVTAKLLRLRRRKGHVEPVERVVALHVVHRVQLLLDARIELFELHLQRAVVGEGREGALGGATAGRAGGQRRTIGGDAARELAESVLTGGAAVLVDGHNGCASPAQERAMADIF